MYKIFNRTGVCLFTSWRKSFPHSRFVYLSHKQDCTWGMKQKQGLPSSVHTVKFFHETTKSTEHSQATSSVLCSLPQVCEPREVHVWIGGQLLFLETHSPVDALCSLGMEPAASCLLFPLMLAAAPCSPLTAMLIIHITARRAILGESAQSAKKPWALYWNTHLCSEQAGAAPQIPNPQFCLGPHYLTVQKAGPYSPIHYQ